jgi:hypothetical protein
MTTAAMIVMAEYNQPKRTISKATRIEMAKDGQNAKTTQGKMISSPQHRKKLLIADPPLTTRKNGRTQPKSTGATPSMNRTAMS